jgi:hypothetical protein
MTAFLSGLAITVVLIAVSIFLYDIAQITTVEAEAPAGVHISVSDPSLGQPRVPGRK